MQDGKAKFIEEVKEMNQPIDAEAILTDEQLERGGLVRVEAFMRTKTSAAAARKAAQREREEEQGIKQVNVKCDEQTGQLIKSIAASIGTGMTLEEAVKKAVPSVTSHVLVKPSQEEEMRIGRKVRALTGWKRALVNWVLR